MRHNIYKITELDLEYKVCFFEKGEVDRKEEDKIEEAAQNILDILSGLPVTEILYVNRETKDNYNYLEFAALVGFAPELLDSSFESDYYQK